MAPNERTASSPVPGQRVIPTGTVTEYYRRDWWRSTTAIDDLLIQADARPDTPAVVSYRSGHPEPDRHTFAELELLTRRVAAALINLGIGVGDVVSVQLPNTWQFPALVYGILRAGAVVNPLVPIFRNRELDFILRRTESRALIVPDVFRGHDHASMAADLIESIEGLEHAFVLRTGPVGSDVALPSGTRDLAQILDHPWEQRAGLDQELASRAPGPDDLVQIQFTSGTTGEPKGVLHSYNTIHSGGRCIDEIYGLTADDVCFMASTLAHQTGFGYGMMKPLGMGMTVVYQDQWDAEQLLDAIETEGVTWTVSATAFAMDMIAAQRRRPRDLDSFTYFICGGAPIPPKVVEEAAEVLGAQLIAVWGMTENMVVTTTRVGDPVELVSDSDGTVVDWMEIRIIDDTGRPVEVGQSGDLEVRGPSQALGYFFRDDLYAAASPDGDWFATGDVARLRPDGGIRIVGRTKDLIIRGGENIPVAEVEDLLLRHPSVVEVAVVGLPDDRLGERACAVITAANHAPSLADLTTHLHEAGMAKQFWPERLHVLAEMPRTPSGKIQKFKLREQLLSPDPTK
ncbi:MAG: AMP-binding protein [Actinomycetota bacterium]|nr:AMP-binding protein [Actinomycetota bacterium]